MPKFNYHLANGKMLTLEGDTPPSDEEVESIAKEQKVTLLPADTETAAPVEKTPVATLSTVEKTPVEQPPNEQPQSGWLNKAWHAISDPLTTTPSRFAGEVADWIDQPSADRSESSAYLHGLAGGSIQGIGDVISGMTSPINLATMAAGGGEYAAMKAGLPKIAQALNIASKVSAAPMIAHGGIEALSPESTLGERGFGLAEMAGGASAMFHAPSARTEVNFEVPSRKLLFKNGKLASDSAAGSVVDPRDIGVKFSTKAEADAAKPLDWATDPQKKLNQQKVIKSKKAGEFDPSTLKFEPLPTKEGESIGDYFKRNGVENIDTTAEEALANREKLTTKEEPVIEQPKQSTTKPKVRLDRETGAWIPIDEAGKQIGPAQFPGKELAPELADESKYTPQKPDKSGTLQSMYDITRGTMSVDPPFITSAAFRQAAPFVGTKAWFKAWIPAAKAFGSKNASEAIQNNILERPLFKSTLDVRTNKMVGPSYADRVGLKLSSLTEYSKRDEPIRGELAERIPIYGKYVASSNRAYNAFLNSVSSDTFESLIKDAVELNRNKQLGGVTGNLLSKDVTPNPMQDLTFGKSIADFVNTSLRRGKLGIEAGSHELNLEKHARLLSNVFFSPRMISSQIRTLNPSTYIMANPYVRKQYLASMVRQVGTWWTIAGLAQLGGASVSKDPNSADFGKIRIGNTRIDVPGGLQQYLVLGNRSLPQALGGGGQTSTTTGKFTPFGQGYKPETRFTNLLQFSLNRLHPTAKFAADLFNVTAKTPFHLADRLAQSVLPMYVDDLMQVSKEHPELAPLILGLSGAGMGVQSYERGSFGKPTFIPEQYDINIGAR